MRFLFFYHFPFRSAVTITYDVRARISSFCNFIEDATNNEAKCESIFPQLNQKIPPQFPPIYKGQETPLNLFNFVIPIYNVNYNYGYTATVISKRHLLTSAFFFVLNGWIKDSEVTVFNSYKYLLLTFNDK
uniref:Uncharacterized protein n=1 Tax=Panagrolaimus superbus TaxID=310955 RepID=A0A914Y8D5_9BILA